METRLEQLHTKATCTKHSDFSSKRIHTLIMVCLRVCGFRGGNVALSKYRLLATCRNGRRSRCEKESCGSRRLSSLPMPAIEKFNFWRARTRGGSSEKPPWLLPTQYATTKRMICDYQPTAHVETRLTTHGSRDGHFLTSQRLVRPATASNSQGHMIFRVDGTCLSYYTGDLEW